MFIYIWSYDVSEEKRAAFERAYGPAGDWVQLFQQAEGYLRTELLRDAGDAGRYVTIDYWASRAARDRFREQAAAAFATLDARCEALTERETFVGDFERVEEIESRKP